MERTEVTLTAMLVELRALNARLDALQRDPLP